MGQWGLETCSCDSCWDCLDARDIHNMTQKEANRSIKKTWEFDEDYDKLGVVVWILCQGLEIAIDKLEECLVIAGKFNSDTSISGQNWVDRKGRKQAILNEIEMIKGAIENGGRGKKVHIEGLLEKMKI